MTEPRYTLRQLSALSGTQLRTLRRWVAAGCLTPNEFRGPATTYGARQLQRVLVIRRMRLDNLPLRTIKSRLAALSDDELARLAAVAPTPIGAPEPEAEIVHLPPPPPEPAYPAERWERLVLLPGLEVHVHAGASPLLRRIAGEIYRHYGPAGAADAE